MAMYIHKGLQNKAELQKAITCSQSTENGGVCSAGV